MDSFNPFANAWGDDNAASGPSQDASASSPPAFRFPDEDRLPSDSDPLGFKSSSLNTHRPAVVVEGSDNEDAWGAAAAAQPIASTSAAGLAADEWYSAPSTPRPPSSPNVGIAAEDPEDSWQPSTSSPAIDASPPAWTVEDDELQEGPNSNHEGNHEREDDYSENVHKDPDEQEDQGGFGGFAEALPDLGTSRTPQIRQDSDTDWGATELPPSKWEEHLNAPPTWQSSDAEAEVRDLDDDDTAEPTNDPWRPAEARRRDSRDASTNEGSSKRSIDTRKVSAEEAELDLERLQSELGIQIRNLDEEYAKQGKSPTISGKSPTLPTPDNSNNKASRWSIWGSKKATTTTTTTGSEDGESSSRRGSLDAKTSAAMSPRSSISTAGIGSAASSSAPQTPDVHSESKGGTTSNTNAAQEQQQQQAGVSRFFRFGKGRANSADPTSTTKNDNSMSSISSAISQQTTTTKTSAVVEITDDFGQLENFDSKRSTSANGIHQTNTSASGYDDFGSGLSKEDDEPQRKRWFWNRNSNRVVDYSIEQQQEEEQDLDKVFSAFSEAPPPPSSQSSSLNRIPSLRSQGRISSSQRIIPGGNQDPFAHLSAAASSIRSSASVDPFDPLDPLAELNQASNITARTYKDRPSPSIPSRVQTVSPPALPPPLSYSDASARRPSSSALLRPASGSANKSTSTPPPLLAPPAPLSSISSNRRIPSTSSLLDDLADLSFSDTKPSLIQASSSPASGQGPIISMAPQPIKPPIRNQTNINILEDDFGDFETATSASIQGITSSINTSPKKAEGPMKLASKPSSIPSFIEVQSQNGNGVKKNDADFFDLL